MLKSHFSLISHFFMYALILKCSQRALLLLTFQHGVALQGDVQSEFQNIFTA